MFPMSRTPSTAGKAPGRSARQSTAPARVRARRPKRFASYQTALKYLNDRVDVERMRPANVDRTVFRLDRMRAMMDALGNPERDVRCVHIAGSKGKGSASEMLASCLSSCGYTTGLYTSPHLTDVRERIRINNQWIDEDEFTAALGAAAAAAEAVEARHGQATYFELLTALALRFFAEHAVDAAVLEVGLGGRLDSTNVVTPEVCILTAIQLEHTQLLGSTLAEIAREKAGIMKPGVTAITFPQCDEVMNVFRQEADRVGAPLRVLGKEIDFSFRFEATPELGPHARVCLASPRTTYEHLAVPLKGEHQALNCGLALAALDHLRDRGFDTPERQVALGLAATPANGRLEQVWASPRILIDGAHTPDSLHALVKAIGAHIRYDSMVVIFGCAADKNVDGMLARIALGADKIIFTRSADNPRACDPAELQRRFAEKSHKMTQVEPTLKDAINTAYRAVGRDDLILVTGSFYLAGEAKRLLAEAAAKRKPAQQVEAKARA